MYNSRSTISITEDRRDRSVLFLLEKIDSVRGEGLILRGIEAGSVERMVGG